MRVQLRSKTLACGGGFRAELDGIEPTESSRFRAFYTDFPATFAAFSVYLPPGRHIVSEHTKQGSVAAPLASNEAVIAEFIAQADVAEGTRRKYRTQLYEFEHWLQHVYQGTERGANVFAVRPGAHSGDVATL